MSIHIGLNLIYLVPGETGGMEDYARGLIPALIEECPEERFTAFVNEEAAAVADELPWLDAIEVCRVPVRARRRSEWVRGEQTLLPRLAARAGVDLLHSLANTAPGWGRSTRVVTVHDLNHRIQPEAHFGVAATAMKWLVQLAVRRTQRVITPSENSKRDIVRLLGVDPARIDVIHQGVAPPAPPAPAAPQAPPGSRAREGSTDPLSARDAAGASCRDRYGLGERPVIFSPSITRPHKNGPRLLRALASLPPERRPVAVLTGYPTPHEAELRELAAELGIAEDTRFPGWVSAEDMEALYAIASGLVFPSLYEGFGAPIVEAMARGVPVACSGRGSLPEVAGDAALYFDPESCEEIAAAIESLLAGGPACERLIAAGRARAAEFSWPATARATLASYRRALDGEG